MSANVLLSCSSGICCPAAESVVWQPHLSGCLAAYWSVVWQGNLLSIYGLAAEFVVWQQNPFYAAQGLYYAAQGLFYDALSFSAFRL